MKHQPLNSVSCTILKGVGTRLAKILSKLDIYTVQDLLFHLPMRYQDRTHITPIRDLRVGDYAVIEGVIHKARVVFGKKPSFLVDLQDASGHLMLRFFHFYPSQTSHLIEGARIRCFGEARLGQQGLTMIHPEYHLINENETITVEEHLTPIYHCTEGISQQHLRQLVNQALILLETQIHLADYLPPSLINEAFPHSLKDAILYMHRPPPDANIYLLQEGRHPMQQRLAFEELISHHLSLRRLREKIRLDTAAALPSTDYLQNKLLSTLHFSLTKAQQRVLNEIREDLNQTNPMIRLVQGDVGSGKTIVAALAMLHAVEQGYQSALMAPTEILAEQHYLNFCRWLNPLGIQVVWLSGSLKGKKRKSSLKSIADGDGQVVIGTHALFQKEVQFSQLALVVIDEQHRFGVHQRMALRDKGAAAALHPHQLIMTATPIPRTLAMTAYADMDYSVIDELPPGRIPVNTIALPNSKRDEVLSRVLAVCQQKKQTYWVCTLIEESELLTCQAAEDTAAQLKQQLPDLRIGLVHGRLRPVEKEEIMNAFKEGLIDLLVATTVIEVGVDVPNASLMIIENPERLGLSQLHQLRGRVGRGNTTSHCVLLYQAPLSEHARARIGIMRETCDGFVIAQKDLELRGPGEMLGIRQTGAMQFKVADLVRDKALLPAVHQASLAMIKEYPERVELLIERWIGDKEKFAGV